MSTDLGMNVERDEDVGGEVATLRLESGLLEKPTRRGEGRSWAETGEPRTFDRDRMSAGLGIGDVAGEREGEDDETIVPARCRGRPGAGAALAPAPPARSPPPVKPLMFTRSPSEIKVDARVRLPRTVSSDILCPG